MKTVQQVAVDFSRPMALCSGCGEMHLEDELAIGEDAKGETIYLCDGCPVDADHMQRINDGVRPSVTVSVEQK
jgi:hypothetical protein